jgi:hypothetical protein
MKDDSWKGEHLIRSVPRAAHNPLGGIQRDAQGKRRNAPYKICAVPNCGRRLSQANHSDVCRRHNHAVGYCHCTECRMRR